MLCQCFFMCNSLVIWEQSKPNGNGFWMFNINKNKNKSYKVDLCLRILASVMIESSSYFKVIFLKSIMCFLSIFSMHCMIPPN